MIITLKSAAVGIFASVVLLNVSPCNCSKEKCNTTPNTLTGQITFKLKDKITGNDILASGTSVYPVPDSIKLKDLRTGVFYFLFVARGAPDALIYSPQYARPANVIDSLVFTYGNSVPDTLIVHTGLIDGWRGDECGTVKDAGITKVVLRNQVLVETTNDDASFTLRK